MQSRSRGRIAAGSTDKVTAIQASLSLRRNGSAFFIGAGASVTNVSMCCRLEGLTCREPKRLPVLSSLNKLSKS
jgi:hypothetical protein